ncbi:MAG: bifunctional DNA-formamidopyrimidine glycosylase/DNA-(apurinic or apyrimidinic site) lyase [Methylococcales bacterium]
MPELPEVETTRRGIASHITGRQVTGLTIRQSRLRWLIPNDLQLRLQGQGLQRIDRRAKYLLFYFESGCLLIHLGMSGSLRILTKVLPPAKHDHVDIVFDSAYVMRYTDPRRFGAILWLGQHPEQHVLLTKLGPEPLSDDFTGEHLYQLSRNRKLNVKQFIMDQAIVTGTGNIYANEALFASGIKPTRAAGNIALQRYQTLAAHIKSILTAAIAQGGTTLRNFTDSDGNPGYFKQTLHVYGRAGLPCTQCQQVLKEVRINNRTSVFCERCQR